MYDKTTNIILGNQRYKGAIDIDSFVNLPLDQSTKLINEYDRSINVNLEDLFDEERQQNTIFRPVCKYTIIFDNALTGSTTYVPFRDNLSYTNELQNTITAFPNGNIGQTALQTPWQGFPQYFEFDFIRTDNDVIGYTIPPNNHIDFKPISASTYNWTHHLSYPFENDYNKSLNLIDPKTNKSWSWIASDGIPFVIEVGSNEISRFITFYCPIPHGLKFGEFVEITLNYNGNKYFQVAKLGTTGFDSEEYYFNISNVGFTGTTFITGNQGFLKRIVNINNINETKSEYYIRKHKILTDSQCSVLTNAGFEQNGFNTSIKFEKQALTPNQIFRASVKTASRSYTLSFNCDVDIQPLRDNQKRPITELFFTTLWRGYFGWTRNIKQGWFFNTYLISGATSNWWDQSNPLSNTNIPQLQYNSLYFNNGPFFYNKTLTSGDTIDGDFCEWNNYEQTEIVISEYRHKIKFNTNYFYQSTGQPPTNEYGYYYNPHSPIQIREFSSYVEEGDESIVGIPDYAYFSQLSNSFRWRDLLPYGFIDEDYNGTDYPFLNGKHYPYTNIVFRITPENYNIVSEYSQGILTPNITEIQDPIIDDCE
jgi:hypothetical protein